MKLSWQETFADFVDFCATTKVSYLNFLYQNGSFKCGFTWLVCPWLACLSDPALPDPQGLLNEVVELVPSTSLTCRMYAAPMHAAAYNLLLPAKDCLRFSIAFLVNHIAT